MKKSIPKSYDDLQSINLVEKLSDNEGLSKKNEGVVSARAMLQCIEILQLNIAHLYQKAALTIQHGDIGETLEQIRWIDGFFRIINEFSQTIVEASISCNVRNGLKCVPSPAFKRMAIKYKNFDQECKKFLSDNAESFEKALANKGISDSRVEILQRLNVIAQTFSSVVQHVSLIRVQTQVEKYLEFIDYKNIEKLVQDREIIGENYFFEFRSVHHLNELLIQSANIHITSSTQSLAERNFFRALQSLQSANILLNLCLASLRLLVENFSIHDYHNIRNCLGEASGIQSKNIRRQFFRNNHRKFFSALKKVLESVASTTNSHLEDVISEVLKNPNGVDFLLNLIIVEALKLGYMVEEWKDIHLNMPRNYLGGKVDGIGTKSMIGSPDATEITEAMKQDAQRNNPMNFLLKKRNGELETAYSEVVTYIKGNESLDSYLMKTIGEITQRRFVNIQEKYAKTQSPTSSAR